jgi:hypothetical protein
MTHSFKFKDNNSSIYNTLRTWVNKDSSDLNSLNIPVTDMKIISPSKEDLRIYSRLKFYFYSRFKTKRLRKKRLKILRPWTRILNGVKLTNVEFSEGLDIPSTYTYEGGK